MFNINYKILVNISVMYLLEIGQKILMANLFDAILIYCTLITLYEEIEKKYKFIY